jgi:hypothetical protein
MILRHDSRGCINKNDTQANSTPTQAKRGVEVGLRNRQRGPTWFSGCQSDGC